VKDALSLELDKFFGVLRLLESFGKLVDRIGSSDRPVAALPERSHIALADLVALLDKLTALLRIATANMRQVTLIFDNQSVHEHIRVYMGCKVAFLGKFLFNVNESF
jgi:hypothetical protein